MTSLDARLDHAIDIRTTHPKLREGLRFLAQSSRNRTPWFRVEDERSSRFHRVGLAEYEFLLALDGKRTLEQARQQAAVSTQHQHPLSTAQSESLVLWAAEEGLLAGHNPQQPQSHTRGSSLAWLKIPLIQGPRPWRSLVDATGWLFSPLALSASMFLWIGSCAVAVLGQDRFVKDVSAVFSPNGWLMLVCVWVALKVVHELGHLVCCQRHGGRVGEVGVAWMLVAPVAYVDLTDSYRIASSGKRIFTCLAGVYVELNLAALAVLAWSWSSSDTISHLFATIAVTASVGSLLFNLNPLMRLDGYHALCDWTGRPNLGAEAATAMRAVAAKIFLGQTRSAQSSEQGLAAYGALVAGYQLAVSVGLIAAAFSMYGRVGMLLVLVAIGLITVPATTKLCLAVYREVRWRPAAIVRLAFVMLVLATAMGLSWQGRRVWQTGWWAVVDYQQDSPVRCQSAGKVIRICVQAGQQVRAGAELLELENLSLRNDLRKAQCELAAGQAKLVQLRESAFPSEAASQRKANDAVLTRVAHLQRQVDGLVLRAPRDGTVIALELETWDGRWLVEGDAVLHVVDETKKKIVAAIPQNAIEQFSAAQGTEIHGRSQDGTVIKAVVTTVTQQAGLSPPHAALAATAGGPLAVRPQSARDEATLLSPHLWLEATVVDKDNRLFSGQFIRVTR